MFILLVCSSAPKNRRVKRPIVRRWKKKSGNLETLWRKRNACFECTVTIDPLFVHPGAMDSFATSISGKWLGHARSIGIRSLQEATFHFLSHLSYPAVDGGDCTLPRHHSTKDAKLPSASEELDSTRTAVFAARLLFCVAGDASMCQL